MSNNDNYIIKRNNNLYSTEGNNIIVEDENNKDESKNTKLNTKSPPLPPPVPPKNIHLPIQSTNYRQAPAPPIIQIQQPMQSPNSGSVPQAPVRTHIKTNLSNRLVNSQKSLPASPMATTPSQPHEIATDAVARLVYKTVMTGSVPSLDSNQQSQHNEHQQMHLRNLSISSGGSGDAHQHVQLQSGKKTNDLTSHESNQLTSQLGSVFIPNTQVSSTQQSSEGAKCANSNLILPMQINGEEFIVLGDTNDAFSTDIIFVLPDNRGVPGQLYISNFRLYFKSDDFYTINNLNFRNVNNYLIIDLPLGLINRIEKIGHQSSKQVNFYGLLIYCKNGRRLRFATNPQNKQGRFRRQIFELLQKYAFPISNNMNYFAFSYKQSFPDQTGWFVYDCKQEYERIGVGIKTNDWRFSTINQDFKFCDTYPKLLVVPTFIKDDDLRQIGEFRSKHRIPVLCWLKFDNRKNHVALLRSSQPLCGLTQKRSDKDENYLYKIYKLNTIDSLNKLFIMDARPLVNAYANRTTGGGHESEDNYKECEISFLNIHNIHVMRESLRKIFDMALPSASLSNSNQYQQPQQQINQVVSGPSSSNTLSSSNSASSGSNHHRSFSHGGNANTSNQTKTEIHPGIGISNSTEDKNFLINLENSKWLEHIRSVLNGALKIVKYISTYNSTVLVHCSDGWDRTAQLTSLAMLMMDKYYRTLKGFQVLIEKEWLSFGHRFGVRMGHGTDKHSDQDRSPIFLQFIDCVWQMIQQNGKDVRNKTVSLWSYINSNKTEFRNSAYIEYDGVVECSTSMSSLQLWTSYYFQYKEVIDDSNLTDLASISFENNNSSNGRSTNQYTMTPPMASSKIFGQAFFHQMVNQMKATVRSYNTPSSAVVSGSSSQEPELIRYKAVSIQQSFD